MTHEDFNNRFHDYLRHLIYICCSRCIRGNARHHQGWFYDYPFTHLSFPEDIMKGLWYWLEHGIHVKHKASVHAFLHTFMEEEIAIPDNEIATFYREHVEQHLTLLLSHEDEPWYDTVRKTIYRVPFEDEAKVVPVRILPSLGFQMKDGVIVGETDEGIPIGPNGIFTSETVSLLFRAKKMFIDRLEVMQCR